MSSLIHSAPWSRRWALAPTVLALAAASVPYLLAHDFGYLGVALHQAFALVCHQQPERSFWIYGAPVAVCARCLGVYIGAAFGLLFRTSRRLAFELFIVATALNVLDWVSEAAGLHDNWMTVRFVLGLALGMMSALLISSSVQPLGDAGETGVEVLSPAEAGSGHVKRSLPRTSVLG